MTDSDMALSSLPSGPARTSGAFDTTGGVAVVLGTRPEAVKLAPVIRELLRRPGRAPLVISTGQHREMLSQTLAVFGVKPDIDLAIMSPGQTPHDITRRTLEHIQAVFEDYQPAWVVVQGDTTTAFAAALAAAYGKLRVAHVEAGLRSGQRYTPFPEEINRRLVDQLSEVLFAPTQKARDLLLAEGYAPQSIHVTGNTVVDALLAARQVVRNSPVSIQGLDWSELDGRRMLLVTAHRRESFGGPFAAICSALRRIADAEPDTHIVYPVHLNPNVVEPAHWLLGGHPRITLLEPVTYLQFIALMERAHLLLTDSGGVQEEAPTFNKPVLVMRDVTERPEGIEAGVASLVGTDADRIASRTLALLRDSSAYEAMARGTNPYGDGMAAQRIVSVLAEDSAVWDAFDRMPA